MKIIQNILILIYIAIAIFVTICLLSINDYRVTEFGDKTLIYVNKHTETENLDKGSLAILTNNNDAEAGDEILLYNVYEKEIYPTTQVVDFVEEITNQERTYNLENGHAISSSFYIGKAEEAVVIPFMGYVLSLLTSQWGFLFLIILPVFVAFLYEVYTIYEESQIAKKSGK